VWTKQIVIWGKTSAGKFLEISKQTGQETETLLCPVITVLHSHTHDIPKEKSGKYVGARLSCRGCYSSNLRETLGILFFSLFTFV